jgi:hypothetical protein
LPPLAPIEADQPLRRERLHPALALLTGFLAGAAATLIVLFAVVRIDPSLLRSRAKQESLNTPVLALWKNAAVPGTRNIVSFTNPVFLWAKTPHSRLYFLYTGPISAPWGTQLDIPRSDPYLDLALLKKPVPLSFSDSWTGTGEVLAVAKLSKLFSATGASLTVKPSRLLKFEDIRDSNVHFPRLALGQRSRG